MLQFTKSTEYGLIGLVHLADRRGEVISVREIADTYRIPRRHLGESLKALCRAGLLESQRGVHGGYRLALEPVWVGSGPRVRIADPASVDPEQMNEMRPLVQRFLDLCGRYGVDRVRGTTEFGGVQTQLQYFVDYPDDQATNRVRPQ